MDLCMNMMRWKEQLAYIRMMFLQVPEASFTWLLPSLPAPCVMSPGGMTGLSHPISYQSVSPIMFMGLLSLVH